MHLAYHAKVCWKWKEHLLWYSLWCNQLLHLKYICAYHRMEGFSCVSKRHFALHVQMKSGVHLEVQNFSSEPAVQGHAAYIWCIWLCPQGWAQGYFVLLLWEASLHHADFCQKQSLIPFAEQILFFIVQSMTRYCRTDFRMFPKVSFFSTKFNLNCQEVACSCF